MQEILLETRKNSKMCTAVETGGIICFGIVDCKGVCQKHYLRYKKYQSYDLPNKEIKKCKFIDCKGKYKAKGYCVNHYATYITIPFNETKKCVAENCDKYRNSNNRYCSMHDSRIRNHGNLKGSGYAIGKSPNSQNALKKYKVSKKDYNLNCIIADCSYSKNRIKRGLCNTHYLQWLKNKDLEKAKLYKTR
jgi:hypothetical protein